MDCIHPLFLLACKLLRLLQVMSLNGLHPDMYGAALRAPFSAAAYIVHHFAAVNADAGVDHIVTGSHAQPTFLPLFTVLRGCW